MSTDLNIPIPEAIRELATALLQEPFAIQEGLEGTLLGETEQKLLDSLVGQGTEDGKSPLEESADRVWGYLCLILQDLELNNIDQMPPLTLAELAGKAANEKPKYLSDLALEYDTAYQTLSRNRESLLPISKVIAHKILTQSCCFSFEAELAARLSPAVHNFWNERQEIVKKLLSAKNGQLSLHPQIATWIQEIQDRFPELSSAGTPQDSVFVNALRYLVHVEKIEEFKPTLAEAAVLLLFFSQNLELAECEIKNPLGAAGTTEDERFELSLRLLRLQKVKMKSLSVHGEFEEALWEMFKSDEDKTRKLLERLAFAEKESLEEVA
jgi:hypothetical protein